MKIMIVLTLLIFMSPLNASYTEQFWEWWNKNESSDSSPHPATDPTVDPVNPTVDLVTKTIDEKESSVAVELCYPEQLGALPIADWRNASLVGSFLDYTKKYVLNDNHCFVHFDSANDITAWIAPFGFYSKYQTSTNGGLKIDMRQRTFGLGSGIGISIIENLTAGMGIGYLHSEVDWKGDKGNGHINSLFFGPYAGYLVPQGFVGVTVFAMSNFVGGDLKICDSRKIDLKHTSWDIATRIEGGVDLEVPEEIARDMTVHPYVRLDFLGVHEGGYDKVAARHSTYFCSQASLRFSKTAVCTRETIVIPNISLGWIEWIPIKSDDVKVNDLGKLGKCSVKGESKSQLLLRGELIALQGPGLVFGIVYEAFIGSKAPLQSGKLRIEWNW